MIEPSEPLNSMGMDNYQDNLQTDDLSFQYTLLSLESSLEDWLFISFPFIPLTGIIHNQ